MLSKTHFERFAAIVKEHGEEHGDDASRDLAQNLADYFAEDNPSFDRQRFLGACEAPVYCIVRGFRDGERPSEVIRRELTLTEAKEHCNDPETSSNTATSAEAKSITAAHGEWFDGFEEEH